MSTKESIYYAEDKSGTYCHIYWELRDRVVEKGKMSAAPIFISLGHISKVDPNPIHLPPEIARQICEALGKLPDVEII